MALQFGLVDWLILVILLIVIYKLFLSKFLRPQANRLFKRFKLDCLVSNSNQDDQLEYMPKALKRRDMTLEDLSHYDGSDDERRICVAINGKIFDVSSAGHLYGKAGPYGIFAGRDASRGLATFSTEPSVVSTTTYDHLMDLKPRELDSLREWTSQFSEKYPVVGRLLKPGESADVYSDDEDNISQHSSSTNSTLTSNFNSRRSSNKAD